MKLINLFTKTSKETPRGETTKNAKLLVQAGFVNKLMSGVYTYLPLGLKTLNKIKNIIREEINAVGGQEVLMPALTPKENWVKTKRWDEIDVLFKLTGSDKKELALGSTHEEIVTPLVKQYASSYKDLPVAVYQIQDKFRDEPRARSGMLRGREFSMKDLYSFHADEKDLDQYYEKVVEAYHKIFKRLEIGDITLLTYASGGVFSKYSHEFQSIIDSGEDTVFVCNKCNVAVNKEIYDAKKGCEKCGNKELIEKRTIEVGNIFKLGNRFSEAFDYKFIDKDGKQKPVVMGCYGMGPGRIMGTIVELLADERGLVWPEEIAPFHIHLVAIGKDPGVVAEANELYKKLIDKKIEVLFDNRDISTGAKLADADLIGIPHRIVISEKTLSAGKFEYKNRSEKEVKMISEDEVFGL